MNPSPPERRKLRWRRGNGGGGKLEDKTRIRIGEIINITWNLSELIWD